MSFLLNEYEIEEAYDRLRCRPDQPHLFAAAAQLYVLVQWTNSNSDGWPYWRKPGLASAKLQRLVTERGGRWTENGTDITAAELRKALVPLKAFRTRQGADFKIVEVP